LTCCQAGKSGAGLLPLSEERAGDIDWLRADDVPTSEITTKPQTNCFTSAGIREIAGVGRFLVVAVDRRVANTTSRSKPTLASTEEP
jgi:hypothetical protein